MWNPWRALTDRVHIRLHFKHAHEMPVGVLGLIDHDTGEITLRHGMSQAQRRSALTHELVHHERGPVPGWLTAREERAVDRETALRLITYEALADAMVWAGDEHELAELLWVDVPTAITRVRNLTHAESADLVRRLEHAELNIP